MLENSEVPEHDESDKPEPSSVLKGKQNVLFFTARRLVQSAGRAGQRGFRGRLPKAHFI